MDEVKIAVIKAVVANVLRSVCFIFHLHSLVVTVPEYVLRMNVDLITEKKCVAGYTRVIVQLLKPKHGN